MEELVPATHNSPTTCAEVRFPMLCARNTCAALQRAWPGATHVRSVPPTHTHVAADMCSTWPKTLVKVVLLQGSITMCHLTSSQKRAKVSW